MSRITSNKAELIAFGIQQDLKRSRRLMHDTAPYGRAKNNCASGGFREVGHLNV